MFMGEPEVQVLCRTNPAVHRPVKTSAQPSYTYPSVVGFSVFLVK